MPKPRLIHPDDAYTQLVDALADSLHVIMDQRSCDLDRAVYHLSNCLPDIMATAHHHAQGELIRDDFCPEGIEVIAPPPNHQSHFS